MKNDNRDYYPGQWNTEDSDPNASTVPSRQGRSCSIGFLLSLLCIVTVITVLLTYTLTSASNKRYYTEKLREQQQTINQLKENSDEFNAEINLDKLELLALLFEQYSYYAGEVSEEELLDEVLRAYAAATGDRYAAYYTEEEYAELNAGNVGDQVGIGVSVVQTTLTVENDEYMAFQVIAIYENAPAAQSGLKIGDYIYGIRVGDAFRSVNEIGYDQAIANVRGEKGTQAELAVFRPVSNGFEKKYFAITRDKYETVSVSYKMSESDSTVGIVQISGFDLTTPKQFKNAVDTLLSQGVEHFVFDVRNNPGGDLASVVAVLSTLLNSGDVILSTKDLNNAMQVTKVGVVNYSVNSGYSTCNVSSSDIGKYSGYEMVVLANKNSASAAELFTAALRDHDKADIVGVNTYGKGSVQSIITLSKLSSSCYGGLKLTTKLYFPPCGVGYDGGIGIAPDYMVELEGVAAKINFYKLTEDIDNQLQKAVSILID